MIKKTFTFPVIEQISPVLSYCKLDELDLTMVDHPQVKASLALQGTHLPSRKPMGKEEVPWLSNSTPLKNGIVIRSSISICWSWFDPAAQQGPSAYGFTRSLPWALKSYREDADGIALTFGLAQSKETKEFWPHDFTLLTYFHVGKAYEIDFEARGKFETISILHTYSNVGDIAKVGTSGLGDHLIGEVSDVKGDVLTDGIRTFPGRTDHVYLNPQGYSVVNDEASNRIIAVDHQHHLNVVGWNLEPVFSVSMGDMPDDDYKTLVCVETAYASKMQEVTKEKSIHLVQSIRVAERQSALILCAGCDASGTY